MSRDSSDVPASFQVGGVTVQSLEPRRGKPPKTDATRDEGKADESHICAGASSAEGDDSKGDVGAAGDGQHSGVSSTHCHQEEPSFVDPEKSSSYYYRYVDDSHDEDEGHTSNKYAGERGFAYRPHPADVVIHSWGTSLAAAFQRAGLALFHYMTDTQLVHHKETRRVVARGSDLKSLLFNFLTELLNLYGEDYFVAGRIDVESLDESTLTIVAEAKGEKFDSTRHTPGTEVKAITMHDMGIWQKKIADHGCGSYDMEEYERDRCVELFVAIDI